MLYTRIRMSKLWTPDNTKCCQGCGKNRKSKLLLMGLQNGTAILEDILAISYKT